MNCRETKKNDVDNYCIEPKGIYNYSLIKLGTAIQQLLSRILIIFSVHK